MEQTLQARLAAMERRLARLEDRQQIENLMARHNFLYSAGQGRRIVEDLWSADENATIEFGASGVYRAEKGSWKLLSFYVKPAIPGCLSTWSGTNAWLRVAEDGMRARGLWMVVATEADAGDLAAEKPAENDQRRCLLTSRTNDGAAYRAEVLLQKQEVCFVREAGQWRIHDLHVSEYFRCPAGEDWVCWAEQRQRTDGAWLDAHFETLDEIYPRWGAMRAENMADYETTYHWQYGVDRTPELQIRFDDTES